MGNRKKPAPPGIDPQQLRAFAEMLRRQRGRMPGEEAEHDRGSGGEAGESSEAPFTPSAEAGMLMTDGPTPGSTGYGRITPRQYLFRERRAAYKSEYNDGELVAMAGVSRRHSLIATALMVSLVNRLRGRGCEVHGGDLRVKADEGRRYVYPDVSVVCGRPKLEGRGPDVLTNPVVVFEILSSSTEKHDRGWKLDAYRRMPSVGEVVLLSQHEPAAEVFRRDAEGGWEALLPLRGENALLRLGSIDCVLPLAEVYAGLLPAYAG